MAMKQLSKVIGLMTLVSSGTVLADAPTLKEVLDASGVTVSGFVDAAYTYYTVNPSDQPGNLINFFDDSESSFGLKQAGLTISSLPKEGFGALVNITAGSDAKYIHSTGSGSDFGEDGFDLTQAYVQYATGPVTVIGGKFNTLAGYEVIAPTGNTNISRSITFLYGPFTHTGVRLAYAAADTLTLYAGVNNGWDQQSDQNSDKTAELGVIWSPSTHFTWAASIYSGNEPLSATDDANRLFVDTVITFKPTDSLAFVLNYDYGKQEDGTVDGNGDLDDAEWTSLVGYVNYQFNEQWRVSLRGEQFNDKDLYRLNYTDLNTGDASEKTTAFTATVGYAATANFEIRGEVRFDKTEEDAIVDDGDFEDTQTYLAVEAIYKF